MLLVLQSVSRSLCISGKKIYISVFLKNNKIVYESLCFILKCGDIRECDGIIAMATNAINCAEMPSLLQRTIQS